MPLSLSLMALGQLQAPALNQCPQLPFPSAAPIPCHLPALAQRQCWPYTLQARCLMACTAAQISLLVPTSSSAFPKLSPRAGRRQHPEPAKLMRSAWDPHLVAIEGGAALGTKEAHISCSTKEGRGMFTAEQNRVGALGRRSFPQAAPSLGVGAQRHEQHQICGPSCQQWGYAPTRNRLGAENTEPANCLRRVTGWRDQGKGCSVLQQQERDWDRDKAGLCSAERRPYGIIAPQQGTWSCAGTGWGPGSHPCSSKAAGGFAGYMATATQKQGLGAAKCCLVGMQVRQGENQNIQS